MSHPTIKIKGFLMRILDKLMKQRNLLKGFNVISIKNCDTVTIDM